MKARGVVIIDYDLPGGYKDAYEQEERLKKAIDYLVKGNNKVVYHAVDLRERRGNSIPDIKKMKIRKS